MNSASDYSQTGHSANKKPLGMLVTIGNGKPVYCKTDDASYAREKFLRNSKNTSYPVNFMADKSAFKGKTAQQSVLARSWLQAA